MRPLLAAVSRKSFLGGLVGKAPAGRLAVSLAMAALLVCNGADMIRTHDVADTRDAILVAERMKRDQ